MNRNHPFYGFDFHDDRTVYQQVDAIPLSNVDALINNFERYLCRNHVLTQAKLLGEACTINSLQQSGPEHAVNLDAGINHFSGYVIQIFSAQTLQVSASPR